VPPIALGERAFEMVLARKVAAGAVDTTWFERHGSTPITQIPDGWPNDYRLLVERRIHLIETHTSISLIERPEYKRRWSEETWEEREARALRNWLLDRLESDRYWPRKSTALQTVKQIADAAARDSEFLQVAALYRAREDFDREALVAELVEGESVPYLPVLRYKPSGLEKRMLWERTWDLQRLEDRGEKVEKIRVPPAYVQADFLSALYWRLRGKLDVPKERFISYPHAERQGDQSLVVGWAGWDHREQATALAVYYERMKSHEGWEPKRLAPLLLGLDGLVPWLVQWHNEPGPENDVPLGDFFRTFVDEEAANLGLTVQEIRAWKPEAGRTRGRRRKNG